jgi:N-acetylglucosaminyl-diphospho-decaprenol L-rhamnosyltransferase
LEKCLSSVYEDGGKKHEIVVVDDCSSDNTAQMIRETFPEVKIVRNTLKQIGMGAIRNQGIKNSLGRYILFVDADTEIQKGTIQKLFEYMQKSDRVAIAGPKLIYPDGTLQYSCRTFPTPITFLLRGLGIGEKTKIIHRHLMKDFSHKSKMEVDSMISACWIVRRSAVEDIGGFDRKYFFGYEDTDLCLRAWRNGWKVIYIPQATVKHHYRRRSFNGGLINRWKWFHLKGGLRFFIKKYLIRFS